MSYITTVTGKHFDPVNVVPEDIDLQDIFHALSLLCRANGHVKYFFTVAQHSINCSLEAQARGYSKRVQLACLLHDAAEAYLSDITRPMKAGMKEYQKTEENLLRHIWDKYLDGRLSEEEYAQVFDIDDDMLAYEFLKLMPEPISDRYRNIVSEPDVSLRNPEDVKREMFDRFCELGGR
ncbi:MAG: HD domain-containing protein [Lachnospiraceae bacterium]|nr:HD domain-containing protein [Lachnospiraceae bacterium]